MLQACSCKIKLETSCEQAANWVRLSNVPNSSNKTQTSLRSANLPAQTRDAGAVLYMETMQMLDLNNQ